MFRRDAKKVEFVGFLLCCMEDPRIQEGLDMIQTIWYGVAIQIVQMAIRTYNLTPEQGRALKELFLKPNDYTVRLRLDS